MLYLVQHKRRGTTLNIFLTILSLGQDANKLISIFLFQYCRIAVVTGGNKGIGLEICRQLSHCGVRVILTARDEKRGLEAAENLNNSGLFGVLFHQLDVTDSCSIASFAEFIRKQFKKLDILVNNAGIGGLTIDLDIFKSLKSPDNEIAEDTGDIPDWFKQHVQQTYENAEECLVTNYYGTKYVTEALLPLLQSSNSGKIVNISSTLGQLKVISNEKVKQQLSDINALTEERLDEILKSFLKDFKEDLLEAHGWPTVASAYKVSKVLINSYTRILSKSYPNLCINCVSPGFVKTELNWNTGILTVEEGAKGPVMLALLPHNSYSGLFFEQTEVSFF
ncbi:short-chain dehydrogenase/reductase 2b-like isoform X1 [Typha latifolia]|uniref:short-chain dehydrogenase/reductase 2b-like isoform X1 n=1 Tax=Typha latifolia TaxID=4733 RepID=UPI003C2E5EE5